MRKRDVAPKYVIFFTLLCVKYNVLFKVVLFNQWGREGRMKQVPKYSTEDLRCCTVFIQNGYRIHSHVAQLIGMLAY